MSKGVGVCAGRLWYVGEAGTLLGSSDRQGCGCGVQLTLKHITFPQVGGRLAVQFYPGTGATPTQLRCSAVQLLRTRSVRDVMISSMDLPGPTARDGLDSIHSQSGRDPTDTGSAISSVSWRDSTRNDSDPLFYAGAYNTGAYYHNVYRTGLLHQKKRPPNTKQATNLSVLQLGMCTLVASPG